jgi:hypothetical protein
MTTCTATTYSIEKKTMTPERIIFRGCQLVSGLSAIYLTVRFVTRTMVHSNSSDFLLSLLQCFLGTIILYVPLLVKKVTKIELPDALCSFFYIFVVCGTVLGEAFSLYYLIPCWDSLLHFSSGIMTGMLGGILIVEFLQRKNCRKLISPIVITISIICFSICVGVVWEFYEFASDCLLGVNMQKWMLQDGTSLVGQAALVDTMKDLIVDSLGAITAAISACSSLRNKAGWLYGYIKIIPTKISRKLADGQKALPYSA